MPLAGAVVAALWFAWQPRVTLLEPDWEAVVLAIAGDGVPGWRDGEASRARFSDPFSVVVAPDGTMYVADAGESQRIRGISPRGVVFTLAGGKRGFADGLGPAASFDTPSGLAIDAAGTLYVADTGNNAIRRVTPDGRVSTIAGGGAAGHRDGPGREARFNGPVGIAVDASGRVIVADTYNDRIRAIAPDGSVTTIAGSAGPGSIDGPAALAKFNTPCGVAIDAAGRIHIADTGNDLVRVLEPAGTVTTATATLTEGLVRPVGVAVSPGGDVFVTDDRGRVVEIAATGTARSLAGSVPGFADGTGRDARFRRPSGLAFVEPGRLIVADSGNALIRLISARTTRELRMPASPRIDPQFDAESFGLLPLLWPVWPIEGPHEIAGTLGEARGGEGSERFHAGIDVRVDEGTPVRAVRDGTVDSPAAAGDFGSLNEWLRIGPVAYVHIRAGRTRLGGDEVAFDLQRFVPTYDAAGKMSGMRVKRGARFTTGETLATVNAFNHVHLNVGWPGEEHNPLRFRLAQYEDTVAPTIARIQLYDAFGQPIVRRARGRVRLSGPVTIVVDAWDRTDGNLPGRRLGLYAVGYEVLRPDGSRVAGLGSATYSILFDRLGYDPDAARLVYAPGSGIPFYGRRVTRFLYSVTNTFRDGVAAEGVWDPTHLPPGPYTVRAWAADVEGNIALVNRDLQVTIEAPPATAGSSR